MDSGGFVMIIVLLVAILCKNYPPSTAALILLASIAAGMLANWGVHRKQKESSQKKEIEIKEDIAF